MRGDARGDDAVEVGEDFFGGAGVAPGGFEGGGAAETALVIAGEDDAAGGEDGGEGLVGVDVVGEAVDEDDVCDGGDCVRGLGGISSDT